MCDGLAKRMHEISKFADVASSAGFYVGRDGADVIVKTERWAGPGEVFHFGLAGTYVTMRNGAFCRLLEWPIQITPNTGVNSVVCGDLVRTSLVSEAEMSSAMNDIDVVLRQFPPQFTLEHVARRAKELGVPTVYMRIPL